ncbi:MAG: peptidylprolyl isomerase [Schleiferiaceae bacterium]|nr:peptidylprolyl isomerase [Schleiferiaceae bacterium]MDG1903501.1 peptidylprolyl isomerase [Schleiferiaceae bacterium]
MRKMIWIALVFVGAQLNAQEVLFTVGNQSITTEEFKAVYEKNKGVGAALDPKTPEEYLELYINFKLKIAEAYEQQRDTATEFKNEFGGYRAQLAKPYLSDQGAEDELVNQAFSRMQEEVRAAHIMIALEANALPSDTLKAYRQLLDLRKSILSGKTKFENAARETSADTWSAKNGGDLGYFTVFNMVYPFESAAYELEVGNLSMPVRSQYGYHLLKLLDRRSASGIVRVRHIFFASNGKSSLQEQQRAERSANEIYSRLEGGEDFISLLEFSEDRKTKDAMGELPEFGINNMMPAFEEAAFSLEASGDYSVPVETSIGWHVIQLIEKKPLASFDELKSELKKKVKRDTRSRVGATRFMKRLKSEYDFAIDERWLGRTMNLVDKNAFGTGTWEIPTLSRDRVVATFANEKIYQSEVLEFWAKNQNQSSEAVRVEFLRVLFNAYSNNRMIAYEDGQLELKHADFRNLVREYKEGILLFDLTQEAVWNKAAQDSAGIANHYELIKEDYRWEDRVQATYWVTTDEKLAKKIAKWTAKNKVDKVKELLENEDALSVAIQNGTYEKDDNSVIVAVWQQDSGTFGPIELDNGSFAVVQIDEFIPSAPKALNEIKGLVIASYQDTLEKEWVNALKLKFEVNVNENAKSILFQELR